MKHPTNKNTYRIITTKLYFFVICLIFNIKERLFIISKELKVPLIVMSELTCRNHCSLYSKRYNHLSFLIVSYYNLSPIQSFCLEISLTVISLIS